MKKLLIVGLTAVAASVLAGCGEDSGVMPERGRGTIAPDVALSNEVLTKSSAGVRASLTDITVNDLALKLVSADGSQSYEYPSVSEFPVDRQFNVGSYTLSACYGTEGTEGFDLPYFYGETSVTVKENQETPVSLTASLANAIVRISYNDAFRNYFESYSATVTTLKAAHFVAADEERLLFVNPGTVTPSVSFTTPTGEQKTINGTAFNAQAKNLYNVSFDLTTESGKAILVISYSDNVEVEDITIDLSGDIENAPAPEIAAEGFTPGTAVSFVESAFDNSNKLKMNIIARAGISSVILESNSTYLRSKGMPATIELIGADAAQQSMLGTLGLDCKGLFRNPDQMAVIDFTQMVKAIPFLTGGGSNESSFTVTVTDRLNRVTEPVTLDISVLQAFMTIADAEALAPFATEARFLLNFNGAEPEKNITFEVRNNRGTYDKVTPVIAKNAAENSYSVTIPVASDERDVEVRASFASLKSELTISREFSPYDLTVKPEGAFAKNAIFALTSPDGGNVPAGKVMLAKKGAGFAEHTSASVSANVLTITGLEPATTYSVYLIIDGKATHGYDFTTESEIPLNGGNLDESPATDGSASNWENYVFPNGWGTNNAMTTSQGSNYGYCRISGTKPTTDSHSGNAVQIRTNGWGSGNSALTGVSGACKYIDAGLFHLGATRTTRPSGYGDRSGYLDTDDLDCGIAIASRPASLSFWYKYSAKNSSDHGEVLFRVIDNSGNTIAEAKRDLGAQDSYTQVTLPLTYNANSAKAAKVYVRFLSTNVADALTKSSSWLNGPGFGNLSRGEYSGSTLFIDDVTFNY